MELTQALIAVALGLPPSAFRRLVQANAATTQLRFAPAAADGDGGGGGARAVLRHMNQSPEVLPGLAAGGAPAGSLRLLLIACGHDNSAGSNASDVQTTAAALSAFQVTDKRRADITIPLGFAFPPSHHWWVR